MWIRDCAAVKSEEGAMSKKSAVVPVQEPMGIVISRGAEHELAPALLTFVWGSADLDQSELAAA
jgi:hypothetical protein